MNFKCPPFPCALASVTRCIFGKHAPKKSFRQDNHEKHAEAKTSCQSVRNSTSLKMKILYFVIVMHLSLHHLHFHRVHVLSIQCSLCLQFVEMCYFLLNFVCFIRLFVCEYSSSAYTLVMTDFEM